MNEGLTDRHGIIPEFPIKKGTEPRTWSDIIKEIDDWSQYNFPDKEPNDPLMGVVEELGELHHAVLKMKQGIRGDEDLEEQRKDAIGDLLVYLFDYCHNTMTDPLLCLHKAWTEVRNRDWRRYPDTKGLPPR